MRLSPAARRVPKTESKKGKTMNRNLILAAALMAVAAAPAFAAGNEMGSAATAMSGVAESTSATHVEKKVEAKKPVQHHRVMKTARKVEKK